MYIIHILSIIVIRRRILMKDKQDLTRLLNTRSASRGNEYNVFIQTCLDEIRSKPEDISNVFFRISRWDDSCRHFIMHDIRKEITHDSDSVAHAVDLLAEKLCIA